MKNQNIDQNIKRFILDNIDASGYGVKATNTTAKIVFLKDTFNAEYRWHVERLGLSNAVKEWLSGLPSCLYIPFTYCDIEQFGRDTGSIQKHFNQTKIDNYVENYFGMMADKICQLWRGYRVPKDNDKAGG